MKVAKFGGTSMGDFEAMKRSALIGFNGKSQILVVSATSGTTNKLIELAKNAEMGKWNETEIILTSIITRHKDLAKEIGLKEQTPLDDLLNEMKTLAQGIYLMRDCSLKAMDSMMSIGERLSSLLFTEVVSSIYKKDAVLFDIRSVLKTDHQFGSAKPISENIHTLSQQKLKPLLDQGKIIVTQGFIGSNEDNQTTTLGRGGSDYSAAIIAEAISAHILEIWTDVPGISTTDPRICKTAKAIPEITFQEAAELANFGAKILHPTTLAPAMKKNIPVFVGSSFEPEKGGTWIRMNSDLNAPLVRAMALRKNQTLITLRTPKMLGESGFLYQIFKVFNDCKISVDLVTTSEISVSLTLDDSALLNKSLIKSLEEFAEVTIEDKLSLISLIGNNINHTAGLARNIFNCLEGINIRMICSGASRHHFCFLVDEKAGEDAIKRLHLALIENNN